MIGKILKFGYMLSSFVKFSVICFFYLIQVSAQVNSITEKKVNLSLVKFSEKPIIGGNLNDEVWRIASKIDFFLEFLPYEGRAPEYGTEVYFGYDSENLYIGFKCYDNIADLRATAGKRDKLSPETDDLIMIYLWVSDNPQAQYFIGVNPKNIQIDGYSDDLNIDFEYRSGVMIFSDRWEGEIEFPLKNLRFKEKDIHKWRFLIMRRRSRNDIIYYTSPPVSRNNPSLFDQAGFLIISERLKTSYKRYEITPYFIGSQTGEVGEDGLLRNDKGRGSIGIDRLNFIITPGNVLTFAINPDFSTAELDQPKIDVNTTYAIWYPEKRMFFFEGFDIFNETVFPNIFYSRTVREPDFIGKYTGRIGNFNIGVISAYDRRTYWIIPYEEWSIQVLSKRNSYVNIIRGRYDWGKDKENYTGFLAMNRDLKDGYNRVFGFDAKYKIGKQNYVYISILRSLSKEINDTTNVYRIEGRRFYTYKEFNGEKFSDNAYYLAFSHSSRYVVIGLTYYDVAPLFRADNSFITSSGLRQVFVNGGIQYWVNREVIRAIFPWLNTNVVWNYDGLLKKVSIRPFLIATLIYQTQIGIYYDKIFERFSGVGFNRWAWSFSLGSSPHKSVSHYFYYSLSKDINYSSTPPELGNAKSLSWNVLLKPLVNLMFNLSYSFYQLYSKGIKIYSVNVWSWNISYQPIEYLTIRLIVQRNSFYKSIDISPLISFEPSPFTAIYIGMNGYFGEYPHFPKLKENAHQVYLKLKYTI